MSGHLGQYDLYTKAGKILDLVQSRKGTVKSLCLSQGKTPQEKRKLYALVCETLKCVWSEDFSAHMKKDVLLQATSAVPNDLNHTCRWVSRQGDN
jgi:hypothetical protein